MIAHAALLVPALLAGTFATQDTLRLADLQARALALDPLARRIALHEAAAELRLDEVASARLPDLAVTSSLVHQSEVPGLAPAAPGGVARRPPEDRYEVALQVEQILFDGGALRGRGDVERARLNAERAVVRVALHPIRAEVEEAFFQALILQERLAEIAVLAEDLEARIALVRTRLRAGAALPGDTAALRAELLGVEEERREADAGRAAALAVLSGLTSLPLSEHDRLAVPDLGEAARRAIDAVRLAETGTGSPVELRAHPRFELFAARRAQLDRRARVASAAVRPHLSAFGLLAYGRPGFELFTDEPHEYWQAGVRLRWRPWNRGTTRRDLALLGLEAGLVDAEEAAFAAALRRRVQADVRAAERLEQALRTDDRIVALREQVERQARALLDERAITPAAYVDARTDLQRARVDRRRHRVELARARARLLTTLGLSLDAPPAPDPP